MRPLRRDLLIALGLVVLTLLAFWNVRYCQFVNFDDGEYVKDNPHVLGGLTTKNVLWAFQAFHAANWHPLTWLSLQLDATLFGSDPSGFHTTNLILHVANTLLLFGVLRWATGAAWRSGLVAALFAVHPLHVESVAWIAERKDVLSTCFWMLTLGAYVAYSRRPGVLRYLLVVLLFVLGLSAKPMLVTLPCVLLLFDLWPLARLHGWRSAVWLAVEKLPLFALSAASCLVTLLAQKNAVRSLDQLPWDYRVLNAINSYASYLGMFVWPTDLNVLYLHPGDSLPLWRAGLAAGVLALITGIALREVRRRPYILVGWLWYLGTLVPVIGLVQVGEQAMADRYTYVPFIGIFIALAWGLPDLVAAFRLRPSVLTFPILLLLVAYVVMTRDQVYHWRDSSALWQRVLKTDPNNPVANNNFGVFVMERGDLEEAAEHFNKALQLRTGFNSKASNNLGLVLLWQGRFEEAIPHIQRAVQHKPDMASGHQNLGLAYLWQGRPAEALPSFRRAVELNPQSARVRFHLAYTLNALGQTEEAQSEYQEGMKLDPNWIEVLNGAAWMESTSREQRLRRGFDAVLLAEEACQATGETEPRYLDTLAAAYAEVGRFNDAVRTARKARELAEASDKVELAAQISNRLRLYEQSEPYRDGK